MLLKKENVQLKKEKKELEKYYLYYNEQFFFRFDIQSHLLNNYSSLNAITRNDLREKNLKILEQNELIVDKNKNKRKFQSLFFQIQNNSLSKSESTFSDTNSDTQNEEDPVSQNKIIENASVFKKTPPKTSQVKDPLQYKKRN